MRRASSRPEITSIGNPSTWRASRRNCGAFFATRSALVPTARTAWRGKPRSRSASFASDSSARAWVRAVGTNALRVAKNAPQFLREARQVLGFPIEVISGREEARVIYLGVAHAMTVASGGKNERRLVVDVGGGSTEFIVGTGFEPQLTESLYMGCV